MAGTSPAMTREYKKTLMFPPKHHYPPPLINLDYAPVCEIMVRLPIGPECFNCLAPDTGSMETLILCGTDEHHD